MLTAFAPFAATICKPLAAEMRPLGGMFDPSRLTLCGHFD